MTQAIRLLIAISLVAGGCHHFHEELPLLDLPPPPHFSGLTAEALPSRVDGPPLAPPRLPVPDPATVANPMFVPVTNHETAWKAIVDSVDDYFRIASEDRIRISDNLLTEGRIDTYPQMAATLPELHRGTSVGRFNRWQNTFQTIRQHAYVRVVPTSGGYHVEIVIDKELEDLPRPQHATAGAATFRTDSSLPSNLELAPLASLPSPVWIPIGRDVLLEQKILQEIRSRLDVTPPGVVY